jgi:hypothetical protein
LLPGRDIDKLAGGENFVTAQDLPNEFEVRDLMHGMIETMDLESPNVNFLQKPFIFRQFKSAIREQLGI